MHRVVQDHIEAYLDGNLLPVVRRELEGHLNECPSCREQMEEVRQTHRWMRVLIQEEPVMPAPGFYARVRLRVEAETTRRSLPFWQLFPAFGRQLGFAMMLLAVLLGACFFTLRHTERKTMADLIPDAPAIRTETPTLTSDNNANRERVMRAIVTPLGSMEGD